jgi:hypothetical protein
MATVAHWAEAQLHGPSRCPLAAHAGRVRPVCALSVRGAQLVRLTWCDTCRLNSGGLLEPAVEKWSTELNVRAATLGPTQDGREGGPHRYSGHGSGNSAVGRRRTTCSGRGEMMEDNV